MRSQEKSDDFSWKWTCHGVLIAIKALLRISHGVLSRSYGVLVGDYLRSHGAPTACTALTACWRRRSFALHSEVYTNIFICCMFALEQLKSCPPKEIERWRRQGKKNVNRKQGMIVIMLQPSTIVQPWSNPKPSTPLVPPHVVVPEWYALRLQHRRSAGPAYRQALAYIGHSEMNVYLHISCLYYFVRFRFRHTNADGRGRSAMGMLWSLWQLRTVVVRAQ